MASMERVEAVVVTIALAGFAFMFISQFQLRKYVSRDRVLALLETPSKLYPSYVPPRDVLSDEGRRRLRWTYAGGVLFMACVLFLIARVVFFGGAA